MRSVHTATELIGQCLQNRGTMKTFRWLLIAMFLALIPASGQDSSHTAYRILGTTTAVVTTVTPCFYTVTAPNVIVYADTAFLCNSDGTYHTFGGGGGGSSAWSALTNGTAPLTLDNAGFSTTFNQTSNIAWLWANTTTGTVSTTNASPILTLGANYWTGSASAADTWTIGSSLAAGSNAVSTLTIDHTGSSGTPAVSIPGPLSIGGSVMLLSGPEGSCTGAASSTDVICFASAHAVESSLNNGSFFPMTQTIASGTAAMATGAITSGSCASAVTGTATGAATTDTIQYTPNADPTGVTGYGASGTGAVLSIYAYVTSNTANFKVCNSTANSITPSALTLNWRITR